MPEPLSLRPFERDFRRRFRKIRSRCAISRPSGQPVAQNQPAAAFNGNVLAFPDTNIGCEGGYCSWQSGLPALVSTGPDPILTWNYDLSNAAPDSMYDALIDNEFSASCSGANPASNANIAIYLYASNPLTKLGLASANPVFIAGHLWYTLHVRAVQGGVYDCKTEFAAARQTRYGADSLDLGAFYSWVQNNDSGWDYGSNYLPPTDCLQSIGTGELWNDGSGLESDGTSIDLPTATASPTDSSTPDPTDSSTPAPSPTGS